MSRRVPSDDIHVGESATALNKLAQTRIEEPAPPSTPRGSSASLAPAYLSIDYPGLSLHVGRNEIDEQSVAGREGERVAPRSHQGRRIGVFTSGGDSQGRLGDITSLLADTPYDHL